MAGTAVASDRAPKAIGPYSAALRAGGLLFVGTSDGFLKAFDAKGECVGVLRCQRVADVGLAAQLHGHRQLLQAVTALLAAAALALGMTSDASARSAGRWRLLKRRAAALQAGLPLGAPGTASSSPVSRAFRP